MVAGQPVLQSIPKRADGFGQWIERARIECQVRATAASKSQSVSQSVKDPTRSLVYLRNRGSTKQTRRNEVAFNCTFQDALPVVVSLHCCAWTSSFSYLVSPLNLSVFLNPPKTTNDPQSTIPPRWSWPTWCPVYVCHRWCVCWPWTWCRSGQWPKMTSPCSTCPSSWSDSRS